MTLIMLTEQLNYKPTTDHGSSVTILPQSYAISYRLLTYEMEYLKSIKRNSLKFIQRHVKLYLSVLSSKNRYYVNVQNMSANQPFNLRKLLTLGMTAKLGPGPVSQ